MNVAEFDLWRQTYDLLDYEGQQRFYDRLETDHPNQFSYRLNFAGWQRFFEALVRTADTPRVLELGGWHGEMAAEFLARHPQIAAWLNLEICPTAVEKSACRDGRYKAAVPVDYAWNIPLPPFEAFVACHVIEHIRLAEFERLLDNLPPPICLAAIEMPIPESGGQDWTGYHGSHIFEAGWTEAEAALTERGFRPRPDLRHNELRVFER